MPPRPEQPRAEQQPAAPTQPRTEAGRALLDNEKHHWALCALNIEGLDDPTVTCSCNFVYPILAIEAEAARINVTHVNAPPIQPLDEARAAGSGGLDVERLAAALHSQCDDGPPDHPQPHEQDRRDAEDYAAEYARLASQPPAEPTDPPHDR